MREKPPRVVLDTNLIVSGVISPRSTPNRLLRLWQQGSILLLTSSEFLSEVENVLHRDYVKQRYQLPQEEIQELLTSLREATERVTPLDSLPLHSRDPKDDKLLALALGGNADYLITGDQDLLVLNDNPGLENLRIITAAVFLQEQQQR
jgi:putative PIN family toxin of toxin-antitoxin system